MRILIVEDEPKMARMLRQGLSEEGHQVDVCATGEAAAAQVRTVSYDIMILDWNLPDADGVSVLRELRAAGFTTPVLMLTARGTTGERVTGLRAGADDYLVKPFDFEELLARLEALQRRVLGGALSRKYQSATLDVARRMLTGPSGETALTAREYALANELFARPGDLLTRSQLLRSAWGSDFDRTPNVVDVYIGYLRAKLLEVGAQDVEIVAVRGMGYRLMAKAKRG